MTNSAKNNLSDRTIDSLHSELEVIRSIYSEIKAEIRNDENKILENINYSLVAVGVTVAISGFIATTSQYFLVLTLPFVFFVLAFLGLNHHVGAFRLRNYIADVLSPRMREIIQKLDSTKHDFGIFNIEWEDYRQRIDLPYLIRFPLSASYFGLHLLFSLVPIMTFFYYKQNSMTAFSSLEIALLAFDVLGFLIVLVYLVNFRKIINYNRASRH